jgi:hypothetical protein
VLSICIYIYNISFYTNITGCIIWLLLLLLLRIRGHARHDSGFVRPHCHRRGCRRCRCERARGGASGVPLVPRPTGRRRSSSSSAPLLEPSRARVVGCPASAALLRTKAPENLGDHTQADFIPLRPLLLPPPLPSLLPLTLPLPVCVPLPLSLSLPRGDSMPCLWCSAARCVKVTAVVCMCSAMYLTSVRFRYQTPSP